MRLSAVRTAALFLVVCLAAALLAVLPHSPAHAAARVDVSVTPSASGPTTVTLTGSGFQFLPNATGGVYAFFGTVQDPATNSWAPSQGGRSGQTFVYASTDNSQKFIAFEGGSTAYASHALIGRDGTWTADLTIPGATFAGTSGNPHAGEAVAGAEVDCLRVQCGIITIGAHGIINSNNESFTPISFVTETGEVQSGTELPSFDDAATKLSLPQMPQPTAPATPNAPATAATPDSSGTQQAASAPKPKPKAAPAAQTSASTWVVLGVVGFAALALIGAIAFFVVTRLRQKQALAAAGAGAAGAAGVAGAADAGGQGADVAAPGAASGVSSGADSGSVTTEGVKR